MNEKIRVLSVNISEKKGTIKVPVSSITIDKLGVKGDAHAGTWHRQVSLLGGESIDKVRTSLKRKPDYGEFAENITTEGFPIYEMKPLDRIISGSIILEVTQIGKKCHGNKCEIFKETGDCIMPKEGIFCRVIQGGTLKAGEYFDYHPKTIKVHIITISDRASKGEYEDFSGPLLKQLTTDYFTINKRPVDILLNIVPDETLAIQNLIKQSIDYHLDIIFTTGGTGIGERDITPEAVKPLLDKEIPGMMELIRVKYGMQFPNALISRSIAGIAGKTLIYTLPGNPKAVKEYTGEILPTVEHSLRMLHNIDQH